MTVSDRVAKNTVFLMTSVVLSHLLSLAAVVTVARKLGVEEFGLFSFAKAFPLFFIFIADMGMEPIITREVAVHKEDGNSFLRVYLGKLIPLRLIMMGVAYLGVLVALAVSGKDAHTVEAVRIVSIYVIGRMAVTFIFGVFQGLEEMKYVTLGRILDPLLTAGLFILFLKDGAEAQDAGIYMLAALCGTFAVCFIIKLKIVGVPVPGFDTALIKHTLSESWPLALGSISMQVFNNIDITMISFMINDTTVGLYSPCVIISTVPGHLNMAFSLAIFPVISNMFVKDPASLEKINEKGFKFLSVASLPVCVGGALLAKPMLVTVFGKEYGEASNALVILSVASMFWTYSAFYGYFSAAIHKQKIVGILYAVCAAANLVLDWLLIPRMGLNGAALATLLTKGLLVTIVFMVNIRPYHKFKGFAFYTKILISLAAMAGVLVFVKDLDIWFSIPIGAAVYGAAVLALKTFSEDEMEIIRKLLPGGKKNSI